MEALTVEEVLFGKMMCEQRPEYPERVSHVIRGQEPSRRATDSQSGTGVRVVCSRKSKKASVTEQMNQESK